MSADLFNPFNHQPISTQRGSGTYTCPAGKYARVVITLAGYALGIPGTATVNPIHIAATSSSFNETVDIWVKAGDVITFSLVAAGSSTGAVAAGSVNGTSTASALYNGTSFAKFIAGAAATHAVQSAGTSTSDVTGASEVNWYAAEYNVLT